MRSNFFKGSKLGVAIKIADRVTAVIFALFWGALAFMLSFNLVEKKYIYPVKFDYEVSKYAKEYGLDKLLVFSVIKVESGFNEKAKSKAGAVGLMQITPSTAEYIASLLGVSEYDLYNEKTNIMFGCYYLRYLLNRFSELDTAICAYNAGEGKVEGWLKNKQYSIDGEKLYNIPYKETQEYREKISKTYKKYSELYGNILDK